MDAALALTPTQALGSGFIQPAAPAGGAPSGRTAAQAMAVQARQGFRIGSLNFMVRYQDGSELTEMPQLFRLPNTPHWFCGIANLHGMLTPVFDLAGYVGIETDPAAKRMLLVLAHGADAAGIVIDGLPQRLRWTADDTTDTAMAPAGIVDCVSRAVQIDGQLHFDLDCESLLKSLESSLNLTGV